MTHIHTDADKHIAHIDWKDPRALISEHFSVYEACFLREIKVQHIPTKAEQRCIWAMAQKAEMVRQLINDAYPQCERRMIVSSWLRPKKVRPAKGTTHWWFLDYWESIYNKCNEDIYNHYNEYVGGAERSMHIPGRAIDFYVPGFEGTIGCMMVRAKIQNTQIPSPQRGIPPKFFLSHHKLRMEVPADDKASTPMSWIHIDDQRTGPRTFNP